MSGRKYRNPPNETAGVTVARRGIRPSLPSSDFDFVCVSIGAGLRSLYSEILSEAIPKSMTDLLEQLDRPFENGQDQSKDICEQFNKNKQ